MFGVVLLVFNIFSLGRVVLYTVFMGFFPPQDPGQNPGQKSDQKSDQKSGQNCFGGYLGLSWKVFKGQKTSVFDQIFGQVFDQIFGQGFDQGFGEGKNHKYSVQYYPAEGKQNLSPLLNPLKRANFINRVGVLTP